MQAGLHRARSWGRGAIALVCLSSFGCADARRRDAGDDAAVGLEASATENGAVTNEAGAFDAHDASDVGATGFDAGVVDGSDEGVAVDVGANDAPSAVDARGVDASPGGDASDAGAAACTEPGFTRCAGRCVDLASDLTNCGVCGATCAMSPFSTVACNAGECERTCDRGYGDCDGDLSTGCEARLDTPTRCGSCARACATGEVCAAGACLSIERVSPPKQLAPLSGTRVLASRLEVRVLAASEAIGAQVQLCRDRACATVLAVGDTGTGGLVRFDTRLEPGVYFWRARSGRGALVSRLFSPVWQLRLVAREGAAGYAFGAEPDFNGDGFADVAVGAMNTERGTGEVRVFYGSSDGPAATPSWTLRGPEGPRNQAGARVTSIGDVNGDGFADLLVGVPFSTFYAGRALVFFGAPTGLPSVANWVVPSPITGSHFGEQASPLGDVNADGFADFAVGASAPAVGPGAVFVYGGGSSSPSAPLQQLRAPMGNSGFGQTVAWLGDVNGDGYGDLAVGAAGSATLASRVFVFSGSALLFGAVPAREFMGTSMAARGYDLAGGFDANGDGLGDLVRSGIYAVGATVNLGSSDGVRVDAFASEPSCVGDVGAGGDVDGDGFDDVVLVCRDTVSVLYGGRTASARRTTLRAPDATMPVSFEGARALIMGDVNNDGFADVLVGAPSYDSFRGAVFVYFGARAGVSETPRWRAEGGAVGDLFGDALAGS